MVKKREEKRLNGKWSKIEEKNQFFFYEMNFFCSRIEWMIERLCQAAF